jgi:hypothetical protein
MAELLRLFFKLQTTCPSPLWFESLQGRWILSCEEAIQLALGTSVVLLRCLFVPDMMHGRALDEVFLHQ